MTFDSPRGGSSATQRGGPQGLSEGKIFIVIQLVCIVFPYFKYNRTITLDCSRPIILTRFFNLKTGQMIRWTENYLDSRVIAKTILKQELQLTN